MLPTSSHIHTVDTCLFIFNSISVCGPGRGRHVPPQSFMRVNAESEDKQQKPPPPGDLWAPGNYKSAAK